MISFTIENKTVNVFQSENNNKPVIYLNTFDNEGEQIFDSPYQNQDISKIVRNRQNPVMYINM